MALPASPFDRAAGPVLTLVEDLEWRLRSGVSSALNEIAGLLDRFEDDAQRLGAPKAGVKPARYALGVLIDSRARTLPQLSLQDWSALAPRTLFEGRDISIARVRDFRDTAQRQGANFADLTAFLDRVLELIAAGRSTHVRKKPERWGLRIAVFFLCLLLALAGYAAALEYRFHKRLFATFELEALETGLDRPQQGADLVRRLTALRDAVTRVSEAAARAPLKGAVRLPGIDSQTRATAFYEDAVLRTVPGVLSEGIEAVLATSGDDLTLYDSLRAWAVLTGDADWAPGYLAGWLEDHGDAAGLPGLAPHVDVLNGPTELQPTDPELMDQARAFAAEVPEPARAWLELLRDQDVRALPPFVPTLEISALGDTVLRRSGEPVSAPIPGLFTDEGWAYARDFATGVAVQRARAMAPVVTGEALPRRNDSPDMLLQRLHDETLDTWSAWLADLRVRPFAERTTAIRVSGLLSQAENPLTRLFRAVWVEIGGTDRSRSHEMQLAAARRFGPLIQYVEAGRMAEIARLFSALNVALGAIDVDRSRGEDRLMSIADRARSIAALQAAPRIVVQIAEDVLAQSAGASRAEVAGNPLSRQWQQSAFPACVDLLHNAYPFAEGPDAAPVEVAAVLGPTGALTAFIRETALPFLEVEESPWRWKPEARFEGLTPESAAFLEKAARIAEGLYAADGSLNHALTLAALAERGQTMVAIGGNEQPVRASGAPAVLSWPGPAPERGVEVRFRESADTGVLRGDGPWGLQRLMEGIRLRLRDDGQRVLLDLRSETGRVFLEMAFDEPLNPVSILSGMKGLTCPPAL